MNSNLSKKIATGIEMCTYIIQNECTMTKVADAFKTSVTTTINRVELVKEYDVELYKKARKIQGLAAEKARWIGGRKGGDSRKKIAEESYLLNKSYEENISKAGANKRIEILKRKLKPGSIVTVSRKDHDDFEESKKKKIKNVDADVIGLYTNIVVLNFNGIRESYTYSEIKKVVSI